MLEKGPQEEETMLISRTAGSGSALREGKMRRAVAGAILMLILAAAGFAQPGPKIEITILYDNYGRDPACATDWGFSCLIRGLPKVLLFDLGANPGILRKNAAALGIDLAAVEILVLSHFHGDHTQGLEALLERRPKLVAYLPAEESPLAALFKTRLEKAGAKVIEARDPIEILPGAWSTGTMEKAAREQSLILDEAQGTTLLTGCAHQGILEALDRARSLRPAGIRCVLGGFHLRDQPAAAIAAIVRSFQESGVKAVGATHCTGDAAIESFRKAYGRDFIILGAGRRL
jgi:7,8-dihydropterin-6-yl-methyl-4-(beta-D-ribofuranosyl)aminobenzene 5'-phosphate synthase